MSQVFAVSKELEEKKEELTLTKHKLNQTKLNALELTKQLRVRQLPTQLKTYNWSKKKVSSRHVSSRLCILTKPTASSQLHSSQQLFTDKSILQCHVKKLDRYSLKSPTDTKNCDLGSGSFGKCTKMILSATEVAVKSTTLDSYSRDNIMYEAAIMTKVCSGHPNLPLFVGVYDHPEHEKPLLIMKFYSIAGKSCTLHRYLHQQLQCHSLTVQEWVHLLIGVCRGLEHIHDKGYLHNDLNVTTLF